MTQDIPALRQEATDLHRAGRLDEAQARYQDILGLYAGDVEARHMLGLIQLQKGDARGAFATIDALLREVPNHPLARTHRGLALQDLGRPADAMADFDQALALAPNHPTILLYRANALLDLGAPRDAVAAYEHLLQLTPDSGEAWYRRGAALWLLNETDAARESFEKAVALEPNHFRAWFNLGTTLLGLNQPGAAFDAFQKAQILGPGHRYILGAQAAALSGQADLQAWPQFQAALVQAVATRQAVVPPLTLMPFSDDGALRRTCSDLFVKERVPPPLPALWSGQDYGHRKIRIAYLSADFHEHATAALIAGLIASHDRDRFEVTAFSYGTNDGSAMRARLVQAFDAFHDVRDVEDREIARRLRAGEFDIAVDLKGHTEGARPAILSHRPCPVQVNYLGYPGTVAPWLDYIVGDAVALPFADQPFYHEKIVQLPDCYQPNDPDRAIAGVTLSRDAAGLPQDGFVFCSFNAPWKITPGSFVGWMRILHAVPGSVLWLLESNPDMTGKLRTAAQLRGIDPSRLVFAPPAAPADHLARHRLADLFLDTLPYNAHTTASDALWAGLPVLTQRGIQFDGRVAASLLKAVGLDELITDTAADYEALAIALARDPARLVALKARLAEARTTTPLFDINCYTRHLEQAFVRMLEMAHTGKRESFAVSSEG